MTLKLFRPAACGDLDASGAKVLGTARLECLPAPKVGFIIVPSGNETRQFDVFQKELGLPFGIWSLVVLLKPEVKEAFH